MSTLKWSESLILAVCRIFWISSGFHTRYAASWHILHCAEPIGGCHFRALSHSCSYQLPFFSLSSSLSSRSFLFSCLSFFPLHVSQYCLSTSPSFSFLYPRFSFLVAPHSLQCQQEGYPPCKHETDECADKYHHLVKHGWVRSLDCPVEIILQTDGQTDRQRDTSKCMEMTTTRVLHC